jgi:uncharacterized protein (TIGR03382 family)
MLQPQPRGFSIPLPPPTVPIVMAVMVGVAALAPAPAHACGGTFCDGSLPTPMPVDQTGEDILFVRDGAEIEAHVRIQYSGEAERFAWLVPLPAVPEVSVGSEPLFAAIARATIPVWSTTLDYENPEDSPFGGGCPPGGCLDLSSDTGDPPPDLLVDEIVGAFEVVVLDADNVASVLEFFDQNEYAYLPDASAVIQSYLDQGMLIAAVKLTTNASANEIHPLVFRFVSDEPCVPIRLTAVAARDDMGIRAYFLGASRWAPSNYAHVVLNQMLYDWSTQSWPSYLELLSLAIDEADGHGFVTEFADEHIVPTGSIWNQGWSSAGLENADAHAALDALAQMGLLDAPFNPQVIAALRQYLPVPAGWGAPELSFWIEHALHPALIDMIPFDAAGFAATLDERLFMPAEHAIDLLETWPYLTRLHTTLSPEEMTLDPTFHQVPDLATVDENRDAAALVLDGADWVRYDIPYDELPGVVRPVDRVCVENNADWTALDGLDSLPRARRIEQLPTVGPAQILVDNTQAIAAWADTNYLGSACASPEPGEGGDTMGEGESGDGLGLEPVPSSRVGCACTSDERSSGAPLGLLWSLALLGWLRRRARLN